MEKRQMRSYTGELKVEAVALVSCVVKNVAHGTGVTGVPAKVS